MWNNFPSDVVVIISTVAQADYKFSSVFYDQQKDKGKLIAKKSDCAKVLGAELQTRMTILVLHKLGLLLFVKELLFLKSPVFT